MGAVLGGSAPLQRCLSPQAHTGPMKRHSAHVVWFKKDLRITDHQPLAAAAREGQVVCLFIHEPEWWATPECDDSHRIFLSECLADLDASLRQLGVSLLQRCGNATEVLDRLASEIDITSLWSHEETGADWTYRRDLAVQAWCREKGILWREFRQDGVVRRLKDRNGWADRWQRTMHRSLWDPPEHLHGPALADDQLRSEGERVVSTKPWAQRGGEGVAKSTLDAFLYQRGVDYRASMSSPLEGWSSCSRISPYLSWGCLSMASTVRSLEERLATLREATLYGACVDRRWSGSLRSFASRLRWHCHFMQKLEDEPRIEFENMSRACDGLREDFTDTPEAHRRLEAWKNGVTGYPMVDACMRCVQATGWLNFRMRAMLMSFASHHLWLHWRPTAVFLGRHFLDFEPGIHFSQAQMQSATTGINAVRIYSPAKQALDQDPHGHFIKLWVPELADVPASWLAEPHRMPIDQQLAAGCRIGLNYPQPIVDHATAYREARLKIAVLRREPSARQEARKVFLRHGSRKRQTARKSDEKPNFSKENWGQATFPFNFAE
jgi:deoxyribodipyrimidine photo-lyase